MKNYLKITGQEGEEGRAVWGVRVTKHGLILGDRSKVDVDIHEKIKGQTPHNSLKSFMYKKKGTEMTMVVAFEDVKKTIKYIKRFANQSGGKVGVNPVIKAHKEGYAAMYIFTLDKRGLDFGAGRPKTSRRQYCKCGMKMTYTVDTDGTPMWKCFNCRRERDNEGNPKGIEITKGKKDSRIDRGREA